MIILACGKNLGTDDRSMKSKAGGILFYFSDFLGWNVLDPSRILIL